MAEILCIDIQFFFAKLLTHLTGHENSEEIEVPLVELSTVLTATKNFSEENFIGVGGFGYVYKVKTIYILPTVS